MPLFEVETDAHIIITWADDEGAATTVAADCYPGENIVRLTKRPRNSWVISKGVLGITAESDPCGIARDCLAKAGRNLVAVVCLPSAMVTHSISIKRVFRSRSFESLGRKVMMRVCESP